MKTVLFAVALALVSTAGSAQAFELTVKNGYVDALTGLTVSGGKIEAFKQVPASGTRKFSVTLPDGKCETKVSATFANGEQLDAGKFDFCQYDLLELGY